MSLVQRNPTEEKSDQRLRQLRATGLLLESVLEGLPDAVVIVNGDGCIVLVNSQTEKMFGYDRDELLGNPVETLVPERFREIHMKHRAAYAERPSAEAMRSGIDLLGRRKDGTDFPVEITLSRLETDRGFLVTSIIRDITRRKQTEQALRESEQQYHDIAHELEQQLFLSNRLVSFGELAASIAHELNNPLGVILGFAQDLLTELESSDPHYEPLKIIDQEASRCKKIVRDLLDFARPVKAEPKPLDLGGLLRKSLYLVLPQLKRAKVEIKIDLAPNLPRIYADAQQLEQVLVNLFLNAVEAMPRGGTLTLRAAAKPPGEVMIAVVDTGVGIPPDIIPKIFLPFFTTKIKKGMGLGLTICQRIMRAHGGRIEVQSRPGQGTSFHVYLRLKS